MDELEWSTQEISWCYPGLKLQPVRFRCRRQTLRNLKSATGTHTAPNSLASAALWICRISFNETDTADLDTADTYRYGVFGSGLSISLKPTKWKHQIQILVESGSAVSISLKPMKHIQSAIEVVDNLYLEVSGVSVWLKPKKWIHHIQIHQIPPGTSSGQPVPGSIWCIRFVGFKERIHQILPGPGCGRPALG